MLRTGHRDDVTQDHELLARAWALPVATRYAPLRSQSLTSICGPTSAGNVLRSIGHDQGRNPFSRFGLRAMSLDQLTMESADVVPNGWKVTSVRAPSLEAFRDELRASNDLDRRYIANFSRVPLFGGGGGHHSPLGGYLEAEDLVFVLDVNAGFGPWLVRSERFYDAVRTNDWPRGVVRGLARFERFGP